MLRFITIVTLTFLVTLQLVICQDDLVKAKKFLADVNVRYAKRMAKIQEARFDYVNNIDDKRRSKLLHVVKSLRNDITSDWKNVKMYNFPKNLDEDSKRQFSSLSHLGEYALTFEDYNQWINNIGAMEEIYVNAYIRTFNDIMKKASFHEIKLIMSESRNPDELTHTWNEWRRAVGPATRPYFEQYVKLVNNLAQINKHRDMVAMWSETYKPLNLKEEAQKLWDQIQPFYQQLHAYIRTSLKSIYPRDIDLKGPIPAHLLGRQYAHIWTALYNITMPFPERMTAVDLNSKLKRKGYTPESIFKAAEDFYESLNFSRLPEMVWKRSSVGSTGRKTMCMTLTWDFHTGSDWRLSGCWLVELFYFLEMHVRVGSLHYYQQYKDLPYAFQSPPNAALGLAVGGVVAISANSIKYLTNLGFNVDKDARSNDYINAQFISSLSSISSLPFWYMIDLYRWHIFNGKYKPNEYNCKYWTLMNKYAGIEPPSNRTQDDFDPGAVPQILTHRPFIGNFLGNVLRFQMFKYLCALVGIYNEKVPEKPLHMCHLYGQTKAGEVLQNFMQAGSSKPWQTLLETHFKIKQLDAAPMLEYYKPLMDWLIKKNADSGATIGWSHSTKICN